MNNCPMHKNCHNGQYELAVEEGSFKRLIPYQCQLFKWQLHHYKDTQTIASIASHMHGLRCFRFCEAPKTNAHPIAHRRCEEKCDKIDDWMKKTLQKHVLSILINRKLNMPQQNLV